MTAAQALLTVESVSFGYEGPGERRGRGELRAVLRDVSLHLYAGESLCVLGENGAGKSTLLKLCAGLCRPQSGRVLLGGEPLDGILKKKGRAAVARRLAYLPQDSVHLFPFTALEVVLMGRYAHAEGAFESDKDLAAAEAAMAQTDVLGLRDRRFHELSGGERRRVLLAQALAQDTPLVFLDEPTAGLDPAHALGLGRAMTAVRARGKALLWTTHDLNLAARLAPRAVLLHRGTFALSGPTLEVLAQAGPLLGVPLHVGTLPSGEPFAVPA